jgi:hypothetical protein
VVISGKGGIDPVFEVTVDAPLPECDDLVRNVIESTVETEEMEAEEGRTKAG